MPEWTLWWLSFRSESNYDSIWPAGYPRTRAKTEFVMISNEAEIEYQISLTPSFDINYKTTQLGKLVKLDKAISLSATHLDIIFHALHNIGWAASRPVCNKQVRVRTGVAQHFWTSQNLYDNSEFCLRMSWVCLVWSSLVWLFEFSLNWFGGCMKLEKQNKEKNKIMVTAKIMKFFD